MSDKYDNGSLTTMNISGFQKYKLSDGQIITTTSTLDLNNLFDISQDKDCLKGYKTRYIIGYTNDEVIVNNIIPRNVLYVIFDKVRMSSGNNRFQNCYLLQALKFKNNAGINGDSLSSCFNNDYNLQKIDGLDCSNITNLTNAFLYNLKLKTIANLNLGKVNNINTAFTGCVNLIDLGNIDLSELNVSLTTLNPFMYNLAIKDLSKYTINVYNIIFQYMYLLEKLPQFSVEFIKPTTYFLFNCYLIEEIPYKLKPVYSNNSFYIANNCYNLKKIKYVDFINVDNANSFSCFLNCNNLIEIEEVYNIHTPLNFSTNSLLNKSTLLRILNALVDRTDETALTLTLGATNLAKLTDEEKAIATEKNWILV